MKFKLLKLLLLLWLLNPGTFTFKEKTYLLMHVAERMQQRDGFLSTLVVDYDHEAGARVHYGLNLSKKYCVGGKIMVTKCLT